MHELFVAFIVVHVIAGATGLVSFWVPVFARKGGALHRRVGRWFNGSMLVAGSAAVALATLTLLAPMATHPQLVGHPQFGDPMLVRAVFGWMMLGLAVLTLNLAWHGWLCARHRHDRARIRTAANLGLQAATFVTACLTAWQGARAGVPLLAGASAIGWATVATNLFFLYRRAPGRVAWLREHIKSLVGAGISVYTAFFAFGAVRTFPALALHPGLWAVPLTVGLALILYHWRKVGRPLRPPVAAAAAGDG